MNLWTDSKTMGTVLIVLTIITKFKFQVKLGSQASILKHPFAAVLFNKHT